MVSYTATGAAYGMGFFLPFIVVTFAMAIICQEMCMRVGAVTHRGYGQLVLERFGPVWGWFAAGDLVFTNLVTLIAEFVVIGVGLAYFHLGRWSRPGSVSRSWRSRSAAAGTGGGSGSCSAWPSSTGCSWRRRSWPAHTGGWPPGRWPPSRPSPGAPLLSIVLNANVLATVLLPVTLVFVILLASDRQLMGRWANTASLNVAATAIVTAVAGCGAAYGLDLFLQAAHLIPGG
jgi:Mn2+/Fe2+ NRAMP family transporter